MQRKLFLLAVCIAITFCGASAQQSGNPKKSVLPERFTADLRYIYPMGFPSHPISNYTFEMRGDTVDIHLPYVGTVYNPYAGDDWLTFRNPFTDLKREITKKGAERITFKTTRGGYTYYFTITAFDNGKIDIDVQFSNAQSCSYSGTWTGIIDN